MTFAGSLLAVPFVAVAREHNAKRLSATPYFAGSLESNLSSTVAAR